MAFHHLAVEKAGLYRAVMRQFVQAKAQFALHLNASRIAAAVEVSGPPWHADRVEVERALQQLCEWGNLEKHLDTEDVTSVREFLRPRFLYQITKTGQAVERALEVYGQALTEVGELQITALHEISEELEGLLELARRDTMDDGEAFRRLETLRARFDQLTARAQTFLSSLQRSTQLQDVDLKAFLSYKHVLIDYLKRFIAELTVMSPDIAEAITRIEAIGIGRLLDAAARRELRDALDQADPGRHEAAVKQWRVRWAGLRGWFIAPAGERCQAEELRAHARAAIPALLRAVVMLHDQRVARSDRSADLRILARWFAQTDDDREAHRLWRAAFGLSPARHLRVDDQTLDRWHEQEPLSATSWLDAPPLRVAPRLRKTGRTTRRGPPAQVIDRQKEKAALARFAAEQARQLAAARAVLATGQATRLSRLGELDRSAFELFLELLGEALARKGAPDAVVEAASADGSLFIRLEPTGDGTTATIDTPMGRFSGEDHYILIHSAHRVTKPDSAALSASAELASEAGD
ncbi:MAG: TIGR02677 family protein [Phycisphaeraceae bacterium]